jgi:Protein of unknown function (DUF3500)
MSFLQVKIFVYSFFVLVLIFFYTPVLGQRNSLSSESVKRANAFLRSLNPAQKAIAHLDFKDSSRTKWSNLPMESVTRKGLWFHEMTDTQKMYVHALLRTVLSTEGYQKALFIIQYDEDIKQRLTAAKSPIAHRYGQEKYWMSVFGEPGEQNIWGWKFEGHHLSLNFTYSPKGITCTPLFVGINPALTTTGAFAGRYIMQDENELGKQLFNALSPALQQKALQGSHPPNADPMAQTGKEAFLKEKAGVSFKEMSKHQQDIVFEIVETWTKNLTPVLANEKLAAILKNKALFHFVWYGTSNVEALHYFRLYSPLFIVEMTNRDGGIQHLHSLWRNLDEDFQPK